MSKKSDKDAARDEAVAELRKILEPGDTVYGIVRDVSRSGMSRTMTEEPIDVQAAVAAWLRHFKVELDNLNMPALVKLHEDLARDVERGVPVKWHRENMIALAKREGAGSE